MFKIFQPAMELPNLGRLSFAKLEDVATGSPFALTREVKDRSFMLNSEIYKALFDSDPKRRAHAFRVAYVLLEIFLGDCGVIHTPRRAPKRDAADKEKGMPFLLPGIKVGFQIDSSWFEHDLPERRQGMRGFLMATLLLAHHCRSPDQKELRTKTSWNNGFKLTKQEYPLFGVDVFVRFTSKVATCGRSILELFYTLYAASIELGPPVLAAWAVTRDVTKLYDAAEEFLKGFSASRKKIGELVRRMTSNAPHGSLSAEESAVVSKLNSTPWCVGDGEVFFDRAGGVEKIGCSLCIVLESYAMDASDAVRIDLLDHYGFGAKMGELAHKIAKSSLWLGDLKFPNVVVKLQKEQTGIVVSDARAIDFDAKYTVVARPKADEDVHVYERSRVFHASVILLFYLWSVLAKLRSSSSASKAMSDARNFFRGVMVGARFNSADVVGEFTEGPAGQTLAGFLTKHTLIAPSTATAFSADARKGNNGMAYGKYNDDLFKRFEYNIDVSDVFLKEDVKLDLLPRKVWGFYKNFFNPAPSAAAAKQSEPGTPR